LPHSNADIKNCGRILLLGITHDSAELITITEWHISPKDQCRKFLPAQIISELMMVTTGKRELTHPDYSFFVLMGQ